MLKLLTKFKSEIFSPTDIIEVKNPKIPKIVDDGIPALLLWWDRNGLFVHN